jgi:hypothetical protein
MNFEKFVFTLLNVCYLYQNLEKNWNLIRISKLLLYAAKDLSLKLTLKKNLLAPNRSY